MVWKEGATKQRSLTLGTAEAALSSMPVETVIGHLGMIHTWEKREELRIVIKCAMLGFKRNIKINKAFLHSAADTSLQHTLHV